MRPPDCWSVLKTPVGALFHPHNEPPHLLQSVHLHYSKYVFKSNVHPYQSWTFSYRFINTLNVLNSRGG